MSGQASGWVHKHGPRPSDLDAKGKPYRTAGARARRLVLLVIADAANANGERSHPGGDAIEEGALYSRSQARSILADLEAEGWIEITEQGGGRGKATVYKIPGVSDAEWSLLGRTETVRKPDDNQEVNRPETDDKGSDPAPGKGPESERNRPESQVNRPAATDPQRFSNGTTNGKEQPSGADAPGAFDRLDAAFSEPTPPAEPTVVERAKAVTDSAWEAKAPRPTTPWIAGRRMVEQFIAAGWPDDEIERALVAAPTWTKGAIEFSLNRARERTGGRAPVTQRRDAEEGRVRA